MAHRSREPQRLERGKKSRPHDRGEKYVAPVAESKIAGPQRRKGRGPRRGEAHELIRTTAAEDLRRPASR